MKKTDIQVYQENLRLKKEFEKMDLDPTPVIKYEPYDLEKENWRLANLLDFTRKYLECRSREEMEHVYGKPWPPVFPGISPWEDWNRFDRWVEGKQVELSMHEYVPGGDSLKPPVN